MRFDSIDNSSFVIQKMNKKQSQYTMEGDSNNKIDIEKMISRRRRSTVMEFEQNLFRNERRPSKILREINNLK